MTWRRAAAKIAAGILATIVFLAAFLLTLSWRAERAAADDEQPAPFEQAEVLK